MRNDPDALLAEAERLSKRIPPGPYKDNRGRMEARGKDLLGVDAGDNPFVLDPAIRSAMLFVCNGGLSALASALRSSMAARAEVTAERDRMAGENERLRAEVGKLADWLESANEVVLEDAMHGDDIDGDCAEAAGVIAAARALVSNPPTDGKAADVTP